MKIILFLIMAISSSFSFNCDTNEKMVMTPTGRICSVEINYQKSLSGVNRRINIILSWDIPEIVPTIILPEKPLRPDYVLYEDSLEWRKDYDEYKILFPEWTEIKAKYDAEISEHKITWLEENQDKINSLIDGYTVKEVGEDARLTVNTVDIERTLEKFVSSEIVESIEWRVSPKGLGVTNEMQLQNINIAPVHKLNHNGKQHSLDGRVKNATTNSYPNSTRY